MIKIIVSSGHKVPGAIEFSSRSAHVTIEAEVSDLNVVPQEAQRLLALADAQARQHLGGHPVSPQPAAYSNGAPQSGYAQARPSGNGRSVPRPASAAQVTFLRKLVTPHSEAALLQEHGVADLASLSSKACSAAIDRLRGSPG